MNAVFLDQLFAIFTLIVEKLLERKFLKELLKLNDPKLKRRLVGQSTRLDILLIQFDMNFQ